MIIILLCPFSLLTHAMILQIPKQRDSNVGWEATMWFSRCFMSESINFFLVRQQQHWSLSSSWYSIIKNDTHCCFSTHRKHQMRVLAQRVNELISQYECNHASLQLYVLQRKILVEHSVKNMNEGSAIEKCHQYWMEMKRTPKIRPCSR